MRINGWILFASFMMIVVGTMGALNGLIALINDEIYVVTADSIIAFDFTTWGWIHLILGIVVVLAGFALLSGAVWARIVAAILASMSIVSQVGTIEAYPFWSIAIIGIDIAVLYAVCTMGRADEEIELTM